MSTSDLRARCALLLARVGLDSYQSRVLATQDRAVITDLLQRVEDALTIAEHCDLRAEMELRTDELVDHLEDLESELRRNEKSNPVQAAE